MARKAVLQDADTLRVETLKRTLHEQYEQADELKRTHEALIERAREEEQRSRSLIAAQARWRYKKLDYPTAQLSDALCKAGVPEEKHERRTLRTVLHEVSGHPPPDHCTSNILAEAILVLLKHGAPACAEAAQKVTETSEA
jgi:hypothetical protein